MLANAHEWQFDMFALDEVTTGRPLSFMAYHLIQRAGLIERLNINATKLARQVVVWDLSVGCNNWDS